MVGIDGMVWERGVCEECEGCEGCEECEEWGCGSGGWGSCYLLYGEFFEGDGMKGWMGYSGCEGWYI